MAVTPVADETQKYIELTAKSAAETSARARQSSERDSSGDKNSGGGSGGKGSGKSSGGKGGAGKGGISPDVQAVMDKAMQEWKPGAIPTPSNSGGSRVNYDASKAPPYLDEIAKKYGIDPDAFKRMAYIESKFDPNAQAKGSSAKGLFQFIDGTAAKYNLTNPFDGRANAEAAARLWKDNEAGLTKTLGRTPTAGEMYLAHQQGLDGATKLLTNPDANASSLVGGSAVSLNGGNDSMTGRQFAQLWTNKFDGGGSSGGDAVGRASELLGKNERQHTAEIMDYLHKGGRDLNPSELAWCAAFVGSTLKQTGGEGSGSNVATSYMGWGKGVDPSQGIQRNDVVVLPQGHREGETGGHVGFATGRVENGKLELLSGNQDNKVTTTWVPIESAVIRRGDNPAAPAVEAAAAHVPEVRERVQSTGIPDWGSKASMAGSNPMPATTIKAPANQPDWGSKSSMVGATAIPTNASIHMDDSSLPAGARTYRDDADVRGNPQEGRTYNISDLEAQDMANKKGSVRTQDWKDPGAAENARNRPASSNAPLPPERPRTFADQRGWQDQGAAENNHNALPASPDTPLPPEKPAEYALPTIDQGPAPGPASVPNPTANVPLPPTRPDNIQPATSGPQQHANYGPPMPNIGPPMPAQPNVPTPPSSSDRPQQAVPTPPPSSDRPQPATAQPTAQNGASGYTWDALQGWVPASGTAGQQPDAGSGTDFGGWLSSLFDNPDNLNASANTSEAAPSADAGGDFDLGAGLSGIGDAVGSFFAGFQKGGPVQSFASGGLVAKNGTRGRPNRVASAQPGVALPPADRGTGSGGGYTATIATSPGYALGGPIDDASDNDVLGGGEPAPAQEAPQETSSAPVVRQQSALPSEDVAPIIGPNSQEAKQQAAIEKYAEQRRIAQESKQPKNLRELLSQTAFNVVNSVQQDYGIDKAVQRQQSQAVPSGNEPDPVTAFFNMLSGAPEEAASAEQVRTLARAVDPYDKMTEGMRTTAGMAAGVEYLLDKGDYKGAQEMARSVMFHQQLQTAKWGDKAVDLMRQGKKDEALDAMVKGQELIPDGTNVKAKSVPGGAVVQQTDENGKVLGNYKLTDAQMMGMALGLKDGSAYWQAIVHLANGDKIDGSGPDAAYERWQNRPEAATATPDVNSPMYKAHQEAIQIAGPQPALPADFAQMSPDHQKLVRQEIAEARQGWNARYSQAMQGNRQQAGFGQQNANREDSQTFQQEQQGRTFDQQRAMQKDRQEFTTQRDANKPMTPGAMSKIQEGVTNAFDEVNQTVKVDNPDRQAAIKSAAAGLRAADPSVTDADAVRAAMAITSRGANIQIGKDGKTLIMPDGREFKALPNVIEMRKHIATPAPAPATQQPSASW